MEQKKYWQSFGELNNTDAFQKIAENEFQEELPFEDLNDKGLMDTKAPRRDFLKYLGFSTAAATVAASCEMPVRKSIPYLNKPEDIMPGKANYFATTYLSDGDAVSVVAKVRDGRPIKVEGNEMSSVTMGATSAQVQASVLDLYDTNRVRFPMKDGQEVSSFDAFDNMVKEAMGGLNGAPVVLLTNTINSPSTKEVIKGFLAKYPGSRHVSYDAVSYSGMMLANEACYGKRAIPSFHFENAKVIVSLGADFLGTWLSPVVFTKAYAKGRKINESNPVMSKHIQFESFLSMTGANADDRFVVRPSQMGEVVASLYAALGGNAAAGKLEMHVMDGVKKAAIALMQHKGEALVVAGSNDPKVQIVVNAINEMIGANGKTINWATPVNYRQGIDSEMSTLVNEMNEGKVGALLVYGANPAYNYHDADKFKAGLAKVKASVSFSEKMDETTELCKFVIPNPHFLESWGDAEPKAGYYSLVQPTINPLFKTRPFQTSLLKWSGNDADYNEYVKKYWVNKLGSQSAYDQALQDGVIEPSSMPVSGATFISSKVAESVSALMSAKVSGGKELVFYQKISIGSGKHAANPWLQELPDPITKATWDNYAMISMATADELGIKVNDTYEVNPEKPVVSISVNGKSFEIPSLVIPGMESNTIAIALGYGHTAQIGKAAEGVGFNAYPYTSNQDGSVAYAVADVTIANTGNEYKIAQTQTHGSYEGRKEVVRETTLTDFIKHPEQFKHDREHLVRDYAPVTGDFESEATLYPVHDKPGIKWGMSIDLNSCVGCGACVVACNAENNIPVVGKNNVMRGHDMHWMRIDRYYTGSPENPEVIFQPMLCQHCDNAPCENVCPVAATTHSSEGINQMAYNRCVGTRYCGNNCPYKVRRFNWADYMGADSFPDNQNKTGVGFLDEVVYQMNDDLTRMVLNPDVTVRSRGVIEKCSFCVQRLQEAKLDAKKDGVPLPDGAARTACQQSCPADAIVFGNVNDKSSGITKLRKESPNRLYYSLEQLHVLPNVNYLAKVKNSDAEVAGAAHHG